MLVHCETAKMTKKTEQDLVMMALAEKDLHSLVTLSATVNEQAANFEESITLAMRKCQDQISCNEYFPHAWPRWSRVGSVPGVSRQMYMNNVQVVDFAVCRFGHSNKGCSHFRWHRR